MAVDNEKVFSKIKKMLAVAHGNAVGGEHERDTAMKMVLSLLAKHNLSMADVSQRADVPDEDRITTQMELRDEPWSRRIVHAVAKLYFCVSYTQHSSNGLLYVFIGKESNVQTAKEMAEYLVNSVAKESRRTTSAQGGTSSFKTGFRKGAAEKIAQRCIKLKQDAEDESKQESAKTPGTALVLASVYTQEEKANQLVLTNLGVKLTFKTTKSRPTSAAGLTAGRAYGSSVAFNKQVK